MKTFPELCLAIVLLFSLLFFFTKWYSEHKNKVLVRWPIVDIIPSLFLNVHRFHDWCVELSNEVGTTIVARGPIIGRLEIVFTTDPRNVEYILKTNFPNFPKGREYFEAFDILGKGILNVDFDHWHAQRRLANTMFASKQFRSYIAKVSQNVVEDSLVPLLAHVARQSSVVDLEDVFLRFAFDNIFTVLFGWNPNNLSINFPNNELAQAIDDATEAIFYRHVVPKAWWKLCRRLVIGTEKKLEKAKKTIDRYMSQFISSKREDMLKGVEETDLITAYLTSEEILRNDLIPKGEKFLIDTMLSFLFAGRDSTGSSLSWFFWVIAKSPHVEAKILEELSIVFSKNTKCEDGLGAERPFFFNLEDIKGLVYLHAALYESFRLYSPLTLNHRGVKEKDILPNGTIVKPGTKIIFSLYAMGRMASVWGKDCLEFKPERWIDENGKIRHELMSNFFAFNVGPRICIGKDMAFTQMKFVAAAVLFNFHVELVEGHDVYPKPSFVLHMKNGLMVRIKERNY